MWFKCYGFNGTMEARLAVLRVDTVYLFKKKFINAQCVYCGMYNNKIIILSFNPIKKLFTNWTKKIKKIF